VWCQDREAPSLGRAPSAGSAVTESQNQYTGHFGRDVASGCPASCGAGTSDSRGPAGAAFCHAAPSFGTHALRSWRERWDRELDSCPRVPWPGCGGGPCRRGRTRRTGDVPSSQVFSLSPQRVNSTLLVRGQVIDSTQSDHFAQAIRVSSHVIFQHRTSIFHVKNA
jgi:hypothetical protein